MLDSKDELPVKIIDFNPNFLKLFEKYKIIINKCLPKCNIYLIGSMAVPMKWKEEIDILVETEDVIKAHEILSKEGFSQGPIIKNSAFLRDYRFGIEAEIHLVRIGSKKIERTRKFVEKLQNNKELRLKFEEFKEKYSGLTRNEYRKKKEVFLKKYFSELFG